MTPTRPVLRWHGGKWRLAPWIIASFPPHRVYVEPFGGAGSVLMHKPRAYAEVYNDLDDEVVGLFRALRDPDLAARLRAMLRDTPFARSEFKAAFAPTDDPLERARRLVVRSYMGFGSNAHASPAKGHRSTGFRSNSSRSGTTPARDWLNYPDALEAMADRLRGVIVECRDAREVMTQHDGVETLHYLDPPYMHETRAQGDPNEVRWRMYRHEMSDADHAELLEFVRGLAGMVIISGYRTDLYDRRLRDWGRLERDAMADGSRPRREVLWLNPACQDALGAARAQRTIFEVLA